jgi:hypothetical protein
LLLLLAGTDNVSFPFPKLSVAWVLVSFGAVLVAGLAGWLLSSWLIGLACLLGVGALGGAIVGGYQGLRGRWEIFTQQAEIAEELTQRKTAGGP